MHLEKNADYCIGDGIKKHILRDLPKGCLSWKFVDASVKEGELQDPEKYRIVPLPEATTSSPQPAGSSGRRFHRTPFTAEDDAFLIRWVLPRKWKHPGLGLAIYQGIAEAVSSSPSIPPKSNLAMLTQHVLTGQESTPHSAVMAR